MSEFFNSLDAASYFLVNSGAVIGLTAALFFAFGLIFGGLTWGRYKKHWRRSGHAIESLKAENALLKRRIAEQATRPLPTPAVKNSRSQCAAVIQPLPVAATPKPVADTIATAVPRSAAFSIWTEEGWGSRPAIHLLPPSAAFTVLTEPEVQQAPATTAHSFSIWTENEPPDQTLSPQVDFGSWIGSNLNGREAGKASSSNTHPFHSELENGKVRHDPLLGIIFNQPPKKGDDLTKIKGINANCRNLLQAQGIYTYKQISLWTPVQVGEFSNRLSLNDLIQTNRWIDQARELHAKKHGEQI